MSAEKKVLFSLLAGTGGKPIGQFGAPAVLP